MYKPFLTFFVRTPNNPFNSLDFNAFETKKLNQQVQEAIYVASPVLYTELIKYIDGTITDNEETSRIDSALYRYISRMSSRCTPFGLFAGCLIGNINGNHTHIVYDNFNRYTRLDMFFLCTLSQELSKQSDIKTKTRYYPNSTLYPLGKNFRYIEYHYIESRRVHQISSIERSVYLDLIIRQTRKGALIEELINYLANDYINRNDAQAFIEELIESQIIVSEISPSVTGDDYLTQLIGILDERNVNNAIIETLREIQQMLYQLDCRSYDNMGLYQNIINNIKEIKIPYEEKYLFQIDMAKTDKNIILGNDVINELQKALTFLNKSIPRTTNEALGKFQKAFYNRYEDKEIPLMVALDSEIGIGYPVDNRFGDISPLLENFHIPGKANQEIITKSNEFDSILFKKVINALQKNEKEIIFMIIRIASYNKIQEIR